MDERERRIRRNNRITLAVLAAFVAAVFVYSIRHIGKEARPNSVPAVTQHRS